MATAIRIEQDLVTVRLTLVMQRDGPRMVAELYRGAEQLGEDVRVQLEDLGIDTRPDSTTPLAEPGRKLPDRLWDMFHQAGNLAGGPVWLQIGYGADILAAYPWEAECSGPAGKAVLRIPNFLHNTYRPAPDKPVAICAAAPVAKESPDWFEELDVLLQILSDGPPRQVILFLASSGGQNLDALATDLRGRYPNFNLMLAPPPEEALGAARVRGISQRQDVQNPWLVWMWETLSATGAQAVHFICPGYGSGGHGALALPETQLRDTDRHWSRFVGAVELAAMLDAIHCPILGMTGIGDDRWVTGLRLLANEISWIRPGPVVFTSRVGPGTAYLDQAYHCLLDGRFLDDMPLHDGSFSVHPAVLDQSGTGVMAAVPTRGARTRVPDARLPETLSPLLEFDLAPELRKHLTSLGSARPRSQAGEAYDVGALRALELVARAMVGEGTK